MPKPIPTTMRAIAEIGTGGPEVLHLVERPVPVAGPGEVLIEVRAAGVNRADVQQRRGEYTASPDDDIPGLEVAGIVRAIGDGVTAFRPGDAVCALVASKGYAEYCVAPAPQVLPVPAGYDFVMAACIPENFFTAWVNLMEHGAFKPGDRVLIQGGASGVGSAAIQLAVRFGGVVYCTAGTEAKCTACVKLGATRAINHRSEDFVAVVKEETGGRGVDMIIDMVGGPYLTRNLACLAKRGRLVQIAHIAGRIAELNIFDVMYGQFQITGSTLRHRSVAEKGRIAGILHHILWPMLESGAIKPLLDRTYRLEQAGEAQRLVEASGHIGKVILTV